MAKVKVCGIMNLDDAFAAVVYGADALGFHVGEVKGSRSVISEEEAAAIISKLPRACVPVLVTTSADPRAILETVRAIGARAIQFHGDVTPRQISDIKKTMPHLIAYKVIHVSDDMALEQAKLYASAADSILLDTADGGRIGGTGKTHDWNVSRKIVDSISQITILAGGLTPDNVCDAIKKVKPYMVDVNSGVSNRDGTKNTEKMRLFIERAKNEMGF